MESSRIDKILSTFEQGLVIMRYLTPQDRETLKQQAILLIFEGMEIREAVRAINVSPRTFNRWLKSDTNFLRGIEEAERASSSIAIRSGLKKLATGYTEVTDHTEWIEEDEQGTMRKRRRIEKQLGPNINAISKLANKYAKGEYENDSDSNSLTIRITQKDRSLTIEERRKILEAEGSSDNQEVIELNDSDIRYLESLEVVPPTKDQDEDSGD